MAPDAGDLVDPTITVTALITAHERPVWVLEAVHSALAQTYPHVQVMIGDDSASDDVERAIASIDDPRVHYHRNVPGIGPLGNWRSLVQRARTDLVASLNDDDLWTPRFLEVLVPPLLEDPTIAMSCCDTTYIDADGAELTDETAKWSARSHRDRFPSGVVPGTRDDVLRAILGWGLAQSAYAAVLRRSAAAAVEYPCEVECCQDMWCTYQIFMQGHRFHYCNERLTKYRQHGGNLTRRGFASAEDFIFETILRENPGGAAADVLRERWAWTRLSRGIRTVRDDPEAARRELRAAAADLHGWERMLARAGARSPSVARVASASHRMMTERLHRRWR